MIPYQYNPIGSSSEYGFMRWPIEWSDKNLPVYGQKAIDVQGSIADYFSQYPVITAKVTSLLINYDTYGSSVSTDNTTDVHLEITDTLLDNITLFGVAENKSVQNCYIYVHNCTYSANSASEIHAITTRSVDNAYLYFDGYKTINHLSTSSKYGVYFSSEDCNIDYINLIVKNAEVTKDIRICGIANAVKQVDCTINNTTCGRVCLTYLNLIVQEGIGPVIYGGEYSSNYNFNIEINDTTITEEFCPLALIEADTPVSVTNFANITYTLNNCHIATSGNTVSFQTARILSGSEALPDCYIDTRSKNISFNLNNCTVFSGFLGGTIRNGHTDIKATYTFSDTTVLGNFYTGARISGTATTDTYTILNLNTGTTMKDITLGDYIEASQSHVNTPYTFSDVILSGATVNNIYLGSYILKADTTHSSFAVLTLKSGHITGNVSTTKSNNFVPSSVSVAFRKVTDDLLIDGYVDGAVPDSKKSTLSLNWDGFFGYDTRNFKSLELSTASGYPYLYKDSETVTGNIDVDSLTEIKMVYLANTATPFRVLLVFPKSYLTTERRSRLQNTIVWKDVQSNIYTFNSSDDIYLSMTDNDDGVTTTIAINKKVETPANSISISPPQNLGGGKTIQ